MVVQYEAKETSQERVTMKKLYRFNVLSPLSVRAAVLPPKTTPLATVFPLQLTLTNATAQTMSIAEVKLAVSPSSDMEIISAPMGPTGTQELYQPHKELKPDEAHSFSFLLTVRSMKNTHFSGLFTEALALGRPVIYWNHVFGSGGVYYGETIQYVPPKRIPGSTPPLNVLCISSPSKVQVGEEFTLLLRFSASQVIEENLFELRMDFSNENTGLICIGSSRVEVPTLSNGTFVDVPLTLCCTEGGLTKCEFLYLFNRRTSAKYPVGRLCTVVSCTDFAQ